MAQHWNRLRWPEHRLARGFLLMINSREAQHSGQVELVVLLPFYSLTPLLGMVNTTLLMMCPT